MTEPPEPPWDRLPHDPRGFFGLEPGFDRAALRRAYNALVRRFRPERAPDEFQRIRAAFEALQRALDGTAGLVAIPRRRPAREPAPRADARASVAERVARDGAERTYDALAGATVRSPQDFVALAVLSDVVPRPDRRDFVGWLVAGLQAWPGDRALSALLAAYCRRPEATSDPAPVLVALADLGPGAVAFFGEPLWLALLDRDDFPTFAALVERCGGTRHGHALPISPAVFRAASLRADERWIATHEESFGHSRTSVPWLGLGPVDDAELLLEYRRQRETFVGGHRLRGAIDGALAAIARGGVAGEVTALRELREALAADLAGVLAAFPDDGLDHFAPYSLLHRAFVRHARRIPCSAPPEPAAAREAIAAIVEQLERRFDRSRYGVAWHANVLALTLAVPALLFVLGWTMLLRGIEPSWLGALAFTGWIGAWMAVWWWGVRPLGRRICRAIDMRAHERVWRLALVTFARRNAIDHGALAAGLQDLAAGNPGFPARLSALTARDYGIAFGTLGA